MFEDLSVNSLLINDYYYGSDYNRNGVQPRYPMLQVYCTQQQLDTQSTNMNIIKTSQVEIVVWDRIDKGDPNYDFIMSDTGFVLESVIVSLKQHPLYKALRVSASSSFGYELIVEAGKDNIIGWRGIMNLVSPLDMSVCNIPLTNVNIDC